MKKNKRGFRAERENMGKTLKVTTFNVVTYITIRGKERVLDVSPARTFGNHAFYVWAKEKGLERTKETFWQYLQEKYR